MSPKEIICRVLRHQWGALTPCLRPDLLVRECQRCRARETREDPDWNSFQKLYERGELE